MKIRYSDGSEDDDRLFDLPLDRQRQYIARCIMLGPGWINEPMWTRIIDTLISVRRNDGKSSFYREIGRMLSPDLD